MKSKLFATIALTAALSAGAMGIAACKPEENKTDVNPDIYAIYTAYAEEEGENALSYEEWYAQLLATAKGDKGDKGDKGAQGPAGTNGKSAYEIWLEQEGNEDKSVEEFLASLKGADGAQGPKGDKGEDGQNGERGNKITKGEGAPTETEGAIEGDMYVDTEEWNVYFFESDSWVNYGSIKGADGKDGGSSDPAGNQVDITANGEQTIKVDLSEGFHIIKADLGATALTTGRLQAKVGDVTSELVLSETRSSAAGGNKIYYGYVNIKSDTSEITIMAKSEAVKATISYEDWSAPTLEAGTATEMPIYPFGTVERDIVKTTLGNSIAIQTEYKLNIVANKDISKNLKLNGGGISLTIMSSTYQNKSATFTDKTDVYLIESSGAQGDHVIYPAIVTFTAN